MSVPFPLGTEGFCVPRVLTPVYHLNMGSNGFISRQEAAQQLAVTVDVVDRLIAAGVLDRYRIRERYVRVKADQVRDLVGFPREWLERC